MPRWTRPATPAGSTLKGVGARPLLRNHPAADFDADVGLPGGNRLSGLAWLGNGEQITTVKK